MVDSERWDIEAKAAHSYSLDDLHTMFQNLLADEFKLQFHKESKEGPVYALMLDKGGSKMKVNESEQDFKIPISGGPSLEMIGTRVPMQYFRWWLTTQPIARLDLPVIDKTGLDKFYDFKLSFAPEMPPGFGGGKTAARNATGDHGPAAAIRRAEGAIGIEVVGAEGAGRDVRDR